MNRLKICLLGLYGMALGLMAFGATAAYGEVGAKWLFAEKAPGSNLIPFLPAEAQLEKEEGSTWVLHSEILKIKTLFLCTNLKLAGGPKLGTEGTIGSGKVLFSGCTTDLNGTANANCTPKDAVDGAGTIITKGLHALMVLREGQDVIKLLPDEGETYVTVEMGAACPIGTKVPVIGELILKDCEGLALTHLVKHLLEPYAAASKLFVISQTAEHVATLLGSAWAFLVGEHLGIKFSGDPA